MRKLAAVITLLSVAGAAQAQAPRFRQRLDTFMAALDKNNKSMCSIAITKNGQLLYNKAIGYENAGRKLPADTATLYEIGSITKMFTAVMIFQLVEEDRIALSTRLDAFFPEVPNSKDITIAQMLSHHSGIYSFTSDSTYESWQYKPQTKAAMLKRISSFPPAFAPGSKGEYSNTNFVLLAYIVEQLTGMPYQKALQEKIIQNLGLTHTGNGNNATAALRQATSYNYGNDGWEAEKATDPSVSTGAGSIVSNAADLDRFITALFTGRLVSAASLQQMTTIQDDYGMGIFRVPFNQHRGYGHSGRIDGFTSSLGYFPEDSLAFAVVVNGQHYPINDIAIAALSIYYGAPYKIPDFKTVALAAKNLHRYEGKYICPDVPIAITIRVKGTTLWAQGTGQQAFPLEAEGPRTFSYNASGVGIDFPSAGKMILHQGGANITFTRR